MNVIFRAATDIYWDGVRVLAGVLDADGKLTTIAEPVKFVMKPRPLHMPIEEPTFEFTADAARNLMTALWEAGIRPAEFKHPNGEINRLEAHLADMRKLVFSNEPQPQGDR
jgi:hypothetical protein